MLNVCLLIDGKDILLEVFRNEDIAKGVLVSRTHVKPRSVQALNETKFLVTYLQEYWLRTLVPPSKRLMNGVVNL